MNRRTALRLLAITGLVIYMTLSPATAPVVDLDMGLAAMAMAYAALLSDR